MDILGYFVVACMTVAVFVPVEILVLKLFATRFIFDWFEANIDYLVDAFLDKKDLMTRVRQSIMNGIMGSKGGRPPSPKAALTQIGMGVAGQFIQNMMAARAPAAAKQVAEVAEQAVK